jgi:hypothetical protein
MNIAVRRNIMSHFWDEFVKGLVERLNKQPLSRSIRTEADLEKVIFKTVRTYVNDKLGDDDQNIHQILFTHGETKEEKERWTMSKQDQNVVVYGCSNTSDIFIKKPGSGTIYIELKYSKRRGNKDASALPGDLQRSIGQSIIASLIHTYVICLIVCETKIRKRENDYSLELQEMLRKHKIELIVRSIPS